MKDSSVKFSVSVIGCIGTNSIAEKMKNIFVNNHYQQLLVKTIKKDLDHRLAKRLRYSIFHMDFVGFKVIIFSFITVFLDYQIKV